MVRRWANGAATGQWRAAPAPRFTADYRAGALAHYTTEKAVLLLAATNCFNHFDDGAACLADTSGGKAFPALHIAHPHYIGSYNNCKLEV